jgi:hypothetical protein
MTSMSDQEIAQTETLLRRRLAQLADHAPTAVHLPGEVPVVAVNGPIRHRHRRAGVIAAVTALVGAGGFTTYSLLGAANDVGAATPEEAVSAFVSAMEQEDVLGMIDVTLPEEVGALHSAVESITSDAKRIDLLGDEFDSSGVQGIDVSIDDLALETNFLEGGLATVTATSGTVSASFDPRAFPFGDKVRELLDDGQQIGTAASMGLGETDPPALLMTVERDGRWYVSIEYTIAEYVRRAAGWEVPGPVAHAAVGFDSPEEAVTGFYDRLRALDLQAAIDTFAPGEDALAWLAPMWMSDAQSAIAQGRSEGWSVAISGLTYETIGDGDHRTLKPVTFTVEGTVPADYDSAAPTASPQPFKIERADGCTTYTGAAQSIFGINSLPLAEPVEGGYQLCAAGGLGLGLVGLAGGLTELPPISVVQTAGKWYVSPLGTALASATVGLHDLQDGSSLFDSALAPYLYGGMSRGFLERIVKGQPADSINPACLPALTVENGTVTGVIADPPPEVIRACDETPGLGSSSSTSSGSGVAVAVPTPESTPATTP